MPFSRRARRAVSRAATVTLLTSMVTAGVTVHAPKALAAAGTVLFNQPFHDNTVDGTAGSVSLPAPGAGGSNFACLTAAGNATKNPLASCAAPTDTQGSGKLRFTQALTGEEGGAFSSTSVPTSQGLDVTFNSYQYGGTGADGLAFVLAAVNPANPVIPSVMGQSGGALGYSAQNSNTNGLSYGYLGVGFDAYGNFSNKYEGSGCTDPPNISGPMAGEVVVRGPGNGTVGYCPLQSSAATATSQKLTLRATTRAGSLVPVEVVFNPTSSSVTTASGLVVPAGDYNVTFTPVGGTARSLVGALPVVPSGLYPSSWVSSNGIPKQLVFGWVASTGSITDYHEISDVVVTSINPVPVLAVSQTSYAASTLTQGSPVTYTVAASSSGAAENQPVTVTETLPAGVLPVGASGPGWVCGAPSGQQISCTNSTSPFTSGTITVNGVVTSSSVTQAQVQSSTSAVASSSDAGPATSSSAPAGTVPAAPTITAITPTNGAAGGANDVKITGTGLGAATAIEIGTAAEFAAGTPATVNLCAASGPGCFTVINSTTLDISAMPGHVAGAVTVEVVTLGTSASTAYTYNAGPALLFPAPPGGEVGVSYSDQLTVTGGTSPFTWSVSAGSLPPGVTLGSTGLLSGTPTTAGTYSFTVKVTDSSGLSNTEAVTLTVIPGPSLSFPSPPSGWTHTVYGDTLTESGGTSPFTWSVSTGSLPGGISLSADGNLSGTPTATGTFSFTVKVTDANGQTATQATSITVSAGVSTTFSAPPAGDVGGVYSDTLTAAGGTTPYTWSVNAGTLPPGLTLSSAGVLAGTPTTAGTYPFSVNVVDANKGIATASITLVVSSGLALSFSAPPNTDVGIGYSDTLTATGGTGPNTWSVSAGSLPAGITLNASTGALAGTATTAGTSSFTIKVTDAVSQSATKAATIVVAARPSLAFPAPPSGQASVAYSDTLTVTGGTGPFTWSVSAGSLPSGLTLNASTGVLSGTPATAGSFAFTVQVSDAVAVTATEAVTLVIGTGPLVIAATASPSPAVPGGTVHFTVTVTNTGLGTYTGATFTDPLANVLDDASYNSNAAATAGSVSFTSPNLTWTGTLAPGATATITFSVTVNNPDTGNKILAATITSATTGSNCAAGSSDSRCAVSVPVSILTISATPSTTSATPGTTVSYTITVTNIGQSAYTGATFTDPLVDVVDDAGYNGDATATAGSVSYASSNLTWTGNLAAGASATITFSVTVSNPDTGNKVLASTITSATAGSNCASGSTDPRCASTVTVLVPGLTTTVSAGTSTTTPGSVVQYTVTVTNSGQTPYTAASFTDPLSGLLDDASYNNDAHASLGGVSVASSALTWTGDLAVGASATVTFSVTVKDPDTGDKILVDTVTSATPGSNCPAAGTDARCTSTVSVLVPGLEIAASAGSGTTAPGSVVHFTVTVTNSGQTPYTGASFTDPLSGVLDDATYNGDAAAPPGSSVSFASSALTWTGDLAVGASATVTFSVTVNNPDTGNKILASTLTSTTPGSNCAAGSGDPPCTVAVPVAVLTITNTANVSTTTPGGVVRFTGTFTNTGQVAYTGITIAGSVTDVRDDASSNGDSTATSGTFSVTSTGLTWNGSIPVGGSVTISGSVTVNNPDTGNKVLTNILSTAAVGSNCPAGSTDPRCSVSVPVLIPALSITQTADVATTSPGATVHYTVTVANTGQTPYTGATVTDQLDGVLADAAYNGDATATGGTAGTVSYTSPDLTWTGNLAAGATATITFSVTVNNPDTGDRTLTATIRSATAGSNCPAGGGDARCTALVQDLVPGLDIVASADTATATPGTVVHYTIKVTDTGGTPYTAASFTDPLSGVLDDAAYNNDAHTTGGTGGTVSFTSPDLTWTGNLTPGATATITFSVTVNNPDTGSGILAGTITSATVGNNCLAGTTDPSCTTTVKVAQLAIVNTADVSVAAPGGVVRYTSTFTNTGQVPYTGITITTNASDVFDDAVPNGDQTATSGTLVISGNGVTWTGSIPAGGTVTVTGTVTVNNPDTGNKLLTSTLSTSAAGSNCPAGGTDPRCTATVSVVLPALTITQTADVATTSPGATVHYTVTVANTGQTPYTGATVTDQLDGVLADAAYNGDAHATGGTAGTVSYTSPDLTWTGNLTAGATATITFSVTVNNPDTGDRTLTATIRSATAGSNCPPGGTDARCTAVVHDLVPGLDIVASADAATATPGTVVHYTITVTDTGGTAYTGAAFTDPLTGVLDDAAYNNDAHTTGGTAGTVSFTSPDLTWTGNLTPGQAATITFSVTINNPDTGDKTLTSTIISATPGNNCPTGTTDPSCTTTVTAVGLSTLTITATADTAATTAGSVVHYTVTVANSAPAPFPGATFTDDLTGTLDDATYNGDAHATGGDTPTFDSPDLTWTGDVPAASTITITYSVTVRPAGTGNGILASTITSASPQSNCPAAADPRCATQVTVSELTIVNTADTATTTPTSDVGYTVTATNTGQTSYLDATFTIDASDVLEDAAYNGNASPTAGTLTFDGTAGTITWTGDLAPRASVTVTFSVTVGTPDADVNDTTLTETVHSTTPGNTCPAGGTDPRCTTNVPVLVPALTITNTPSTTTATPGSTVGYTVTVTDSGQTPYTGATVTDSLDGVLGDAAYKNDATATVTAGTGTGTAGTVGYASPDLTWTGNLTVGETVTITYSVTVRNPDTGGKLMVNLVTSTDPGSTCPFDSPNPGCAVSIPVLTPALTITQAAGPATATPGQKVTYTITVTNSGQTPYTGATVTDPLSNVIDEATYGNDATARIDTTVGTPSAGTVSYASPVLTWTGDLAPGDTVTITFTATVNNPDTGNHTLAATLASTAAGNNCPSGTTDPRCTTTVPVATLSITNAANVSTTTPGGRIDYTITITNTGQVPYDSAVVTDPLTGVIDDSVAFGDGAATTAGSVSYVSPDLTWTGNLAPGQAATVTFSVTVDNPDTGDKTIASTLTSTAAGSTCPPSGPAPACTSTVTVLIPALTITKTASVSTTTPGSTVRYTITVADTGPTPYTAATITDPLGNVLNDGTYGNNAGATSGAVSYASPVITWTGDLAVGASAVITYTVTVNNPDTGDKDLVNTVTSTTQGSNCPPGGTGPACTATVTDLIPALTITKTASVATTSPGSTVGYTITVADTGQTSYSPATVTDSLSGVLADAAYNGDAATTTATTAGAGTAGTVSYASPVLTWTGALAPGDTATITYSVTVGSPDTGGKVLSNAAASADPGSSCPAGSTGSPCAVTVPVIAGALTITAPDSSNLGTASTGSNLSGDLGTVQVTDNRGFGAGWTATVSSTSFATGTGTGPETIPASDASYNITVLSQATGPATFTPVPVTQLSTAPQPVVSASNVTGNTTATWNPIITVTVPPRAIVGPYTATITHSVS